MSALLVVRPRAAMLAAALGTSLLITGLLIAYAPRIAAAQPATGSITGRVLWGSCVRIPLPAQSSGQPDTTPSDATPSAEAQPASPDVQPVPVPGQPLPPGPASRFPQPRALPAGAVLVAVQNTSLSARTDETGHFSISGVPAGQYLTVAAGPVANSMEAIAERPNVLLNGGQSLDVGTLVLGGASPLGIACRAVGPAADTTTPDSSP
jgi:hypothetical protein